MSAVAGLLVVFAWRVSRGEDETAQLSPPVVLPSALTPKLRAETTSRFGVSDFLPMLETTEAADLLDWLRTRVTATTSSEEIMAVLESIAQRRPALALELAQSIGRTEEEKTGWVMQVMNGWADREPQNAWQWLAQQSSDPLDQFANGALLRVVCDAIAARTPKMLLENIDALGSREKTSNGIVPLVAIHVGFEALCASGNVDVAQTALEAWIRNPVPKEIGSAAYEVVALELAKSSPDEAAVWLQSLPSSEDRNAALSTFASDWAARDAAAALTWAESLAPEEGRHGALERAFGDWAERGGAGPSEWLGDYLARTESTPDDDPLIASLVGQSSVMRSNPGVALRWTGLMANAEKRERIEEDVLRRWSRRELGAAVQYVWSAPAISSERKQVLIQKLLSRRASTDALAELNLD